MNDDPTNRTLSLLQRSRRLMPMVAIAMAACNAGDERSGATEGLDSAALHSQSAAGVLADTTPVRALDYAVTADRYRSWAQAQRSLAVLPIATPAPTVRLRQLSDADVDRAVARLDADRDARTAIERAGLSTRDFVLTTLALAQARAAVDGGDRIRYVDLPRENLQLYERNRDDYLRFDRGARHRLVDDGDSDSESDTDGDTDEDTEKDRDNGRDRRRDRDRERETRPRP